MTVTVAVTQEALSTLAPPRQHAAHAVAALSGKLASEVVGKLSPAIRAKMVVC